MFFYYKLSAACGLTSVTSDSVGNPGDKSSLCVILGPYLCVYRISLQYV